VGVLLEAVIICGEIIVLSATRIRFFIVIRCSELVGAIVCSTEYGGIFSGNPGGFNDVGSDLNCGFCWEVCISVFLYEFLVVIEVLDKFPGVMC